MNVRQLGISPRSVAIAAGLLGMVSLAIGAHAALNKRALDAAKAIGTEQARSPPASPRASRSSSATAITPTPPPPWRSRSTTPAR